MISYKQESHLTHENNFAYSLTFNNKDLLTEYPYQSINFTYKLPQPSKYIQTYGIDDNIIIFNININITINIIFHLNIYLHPKKIIRNNPFTILLSKYSQEFQFIDNYIIINNS